MSIPEAVTTEHHSLWQRLYHGETTFDFVGHLRRWLIISGVVIVVGLISLASRGLNLGIDFKGGTVWEVPRNGVSVEEVESAASSAGAVDPTVQILTSEGEQRVRVSARSLSLDDANKVSSKLVTITKSKPSEVNLTSVGPSWGKSISTKALRALIVFLIVLTIYITFRFELKMAIPTLVALVHDILITIGVYSLCGFQVTPATVVSLLTILGFSIYDGIVVFDKVDENTHLVGTNTGMTYSDMVNLSLNQVLMRSINTSLTAVIPVGSLLVLGSFVLGATTLEEFALALLIGLFAGAYSSIFIASPMLAVLKEREPRYRDVRERIEKGPKKARAAVPAPVAAGGVVSSSAADDAEVDEGEVAASITPTLASSGRVIPPRPRKKGKRR